MKEKTSLPQEPPERVKSVDPSLAQAQRKSSLFYRFTRNVFLKAVAEVVSRLVYLVFFLYLARKLGDESFGVFSFAFSFAGIFAILIDPGLNLLLTREIAAERQGGADLTNLVGKIKIALSLVALLLSTGTAILSGFDRFTLSIVFMMCVTLVLNALMEFHIAIFNGYEEMEYDVLLRVLNKLLISGLGILAILNGANVFIVVVVMAGAMLCIVVLGFYLLRKRLFLASTRLTIQTSKSVFLPALPIALTMIFNALYLKLDVVLMSSLNIGSAEIGWYAASMRLVETLTFVPAFIVGGAFPVFASLVISSRQSFLGAVAKLSQVLMVVAVPIVVTISLSAKLIIEMLYGPAYDHSIKALQVLGWSLLFIFWNFHFSNIFVAMNRQKINALLSGIGVFCNVAANIYFISRNGYMGACVATLVTHGVLCILNVYFIRQVVPVGTLGAVAWKPWLGGILMAASIIVLPFESFALTLTASFVVYVCSLFALRTFSSEDISLAKSFFMRNITQAVSIEL